MAHALCWPEVLAFVLYRPSYKRHLLYAPVCVTVLYSLIIDIALFIYWPWSR